MGGGNEDAHIRPVLSVFRSLVAKGSGPAAGPVSDLPCAVTQDVSTIAVEPPPGWCPTEWMKRSCRPVWPLCGRDHNCRARTVQEAVAGRDEMGYEAAVPDRAASHRAPPAISFLNLISARG